MKKILLLFFLTSILTAQGTSSSVTTTIEENGFVLKIENVSPKFFETIQGKFRVRDYFEYTDVSHPGNWKLPKQNIIISIPPNFTISTEVRSKTINEIGSTIPKLNPAIDRMDDSTLSIKDFENFEISEKRNPRDIVKVLSYFWLRDFYCAAIEVNTALFNESENKIIEYSDIEIHITLNSPIILKEYSPIKIVSSFDHELSKLIGNSSIVEHFRSNRIFSLPDTIGNWINYISTYLKIGVSEDRVFRLSKIDLENIGINTSVINPNMIQLFESGVEQKIYVSGENDGVCDDSDYVEFYGKKNYGKKNYKLINSSNDEYHEYLDRYTDTTLYFLTWGKTPGLRIDSLLINQTNIPDTLEYYIQTLHYEKNTMFQNMNNDEVANQTPNWNKNKTWYWDWLFVQKRDFPFTLTDIYLDKPAKIFFKATSTASNLSSDAHTLSLSFNGTALDSQHINRFDQVLLQGRFQSNLLLVGSNKFSVQNYENGTSPNQIGVDWYEIEYPRQLKLINDSLLFKLDDSISPGLKVIKVGNANASQYLIYKINPDLKRIETYQVNNGILTFADSVLGGESYVVITPDKPLKPKFYGLKQFKNLRSPSMQGEYIAITHPKFWNNAQNYVNEIGSLFSISTLLINVEDIFDEFTFGYPDPHAIRLFCQSAFVNWQAPKPSYLVLLGDANYDYKQYRFKNDGVVGGGNYVPSYGDPVSDNWYAVWDENALPIPQLFVGRLPINSGSELQYYLSKVKNNINAPYDSWNKRYLFFSGGRANYPEEIAQLKNVNDNLINTLIAPPIISGFYKHFYKTTSPQTDFGPYTSSEIQQAISNGGVFISYIGHSGTATWDNSINEVSQIKNTLNRNPLVTDFGCSTNKFAEPDIVCFGERFVLGENGQALGYVGNSSLGFTSSAYAVPKYFYQSLIEDSTANIGRSHLGAKIKMFNQSGSSDVFKVFALTNSLIGDPIVSLKIPPKPNLKITPASIQYTATQLNDGSDSVAFRIAISNLGLAIEDTFAVSITHNYKNELVENKFLSLSKLEREDTVTIWIKTKNLAGEHSLNIFLDPDNKISEIYKDDNQADLFFTVVSNVLRDNFGSEVENSQPRNLFILNPVIADYKKLNVKYQISETKDFLSPNEFIIPEDSVITKVQLPNLLPDYRYWFRYKVDNETAQYAFTKSFRNTKSEKFSVSDSISFKNQEMEGVQFHNSVVTLSNDSINISVLSAGWYAGATCLLSKNGTNLLSNTFFAGMGIAVFDQTTLEVDTVDWYQLFGNPTAVQKLADFINSIPNGKIVAMGVADDARNNLSTNLKNAIKTLGSTQIDQLQFRGSWAIIGEKGGVPGSAIEIVKGPYDGNIIIDTSFSPLRFSGLLKTKKVGPSQKWKYAKVKHLNNEDSKIIVNVYGLDDKTLEDSLFSVELQDSILDLSAVDNNKYSYLKLQLHETVSSNRISPEISSIGIEFTSPAELATNYQVVSVSRDTLIQGDSLDLMFYVYNVGESPADSFHVLVDVMKEDNSSRQLLDTVIASLDSMQRKLFTLNYMTNTTDGKGNMGFKIKIDPENRVRELYKDNNEFTIPFFTKPDTNVVSVSASTVDVTFDNTEILNGDFVSSNPNIKIDLKYPTWFAVSDTSSLSILLDNEKIPFNQLNIKNDSANRTLTFAFVPSLTNGEHQFKIFGNNVYGKLDNQPGFERVFIVSNELAIMNCYNYPNPIKDNTYFTFKLPQLPEELTIRVYTIAGRLVKEIKKSSAELSMDFNRIFWDTKDQDGDQLANGVYLYKVIAKKNGKSESITQKLAIVK